MPGRYHIRTRDNKARHAGAVDNMVQEVKRRVHTFMSADSAWSRNAHQQLYYVLVLS